MEDDKSNKTQEATVTNMTNVTNGGFFYGSKK
jgi:hypothetical protein